MKYLLKAQTAVASLLMLGAPLSPALAGRGAEFLPADMAPIQRQGSPSIGGTRQFSMMGDKMAMPPAPAPNGGAGMAPAPTAAPMPGGMMDDDKMGMPPAAGMPGMPAAPPGGMPAVGPGMMPMMGMPGMPAAPPGGMPAVGPGMMEMMMGQMAKMQGPPAAPLDHVEGRIAFIKAELGITDAQGQAWDEFAQALRTSRGHLAEARQALVVSAAGQSSASSRLEAYEHHLSMRVDSLHGARESFQRLYAMLSPAQQKAADELVTPLLASF